MTLLYIDSLSFYIWTVVIILMSIGIGYIYGDIIRNKKTEKENNDIIKSLNNSLFIPLLGKILHDNELDLRKIENTLDILLNEDNNCERKIMLIKKAITGVST